MTLVLAGKWRNWSGGQIWAENTNGRRDRWDRFQLTGFCRGSAFYPQALPSLPENPGPS
jgi:hypothetical protein